MTQPTNTRYLTRRSMLGLMALSAAAAAAPASVAATSGSSGQGHSSLQGMTAIRGRVASATPTSLSISRAGEGSTLIQISQSTRMYTGGLGAVNDVRSFVKGDEVVVEGRPSSTGEFIARAVGSSLQRLKASTIMEVDRSSRTVVTDSGAFTFSSAELPGAHPLALSADSFRPSMRIEGLYWTEPRSGNKVIVIAQAV